MDSSIVDNGCVILYPVQDKKFQVHLEAYYSS